MLLEEPGRPLRARRGAPSRSAAPGQLKLRVEACGVCRTDLHLRDGELEPGHLPLVLGHQIVGDRRATAGASACRGWAGPAASARICRSGRENLCVRARFTGRDIDGGYAEWAVADERFCFPLPARRRPAAARAAAVRRADRAPRAAARGRRRAARPLRLRRRRAHHLPGRGRTRAGACSRSPAPRTRAAQALARSLGAEWAGDATAPGPEPLDAALIFAPVGRARAPRRCRRRSRRHRGVRRHPHVRHPLLPLSGPVGGAGAALRGESHPRRRRGVPRARPAGAGANDRHPRSPSRKRRQPSIACVRGRSRARRWWSRLVDGGRLRVVCCRRAFGVGGGCCLTARLHCLIAGSRSSSRRAPCSRSRPPPAKPRLHVTLVVGNSRLRAAGRPRDRRPGLVDVHAPARRRRPPAGPRCAPRPCSGTSWRTAAGSASSDSETETTGAVRGGLGLDRRRLASRVVRRRLASSALRVDGARHRLGPRRAVPDT